MDKLVNPLQLLPQLDSPSQLSQYTDEQLLQLAVEIREVLCNVVSDRTAHFASNLGVVELAIALHLVFVPTEYQDPRVASPSRNTCSVPVSCSPLHRRVLATSTAS